MRFSMRNIPGIGTDLVMLPRFADFLARHEDALDEIWTARELEAADRKARQRVLYLATRWALKEAVLKAIGTGWQAGVQWADIEAVGQVFVPQIFLYATAGQVAEKYGAVGVIGSTARAGPCVIAVAKLLFQRRDASERMDDEVFPR